MKLDWAHVASRIAKGEDERTELKLWDAFPDKVAVAICALANSDGGLLVVGVGDDRALVGVPGDLDATQEKLSSLLQTGLSAPVSAQLGHHLENGAAIHWIDVRRTRGPEPLRRKGRVYVRRGRTSVEPSPSELQELFNVFGFIVTEEQILPGSSPADIDVHAFRTFLERQGLELDEEPQPEIGADLRTRMVAREIGGETCLTVYGALCFGKTPQACLPLQSAWIDLVAYAGADRADAVILHGEAKGRLDEQIERAVGWLKALGMQERYDGIHREESLVVPERAFREVIVNAVAHRDYAILGSSVLVEVFADRLDVTSPGTLPNHMTEATVLAGAAPRARNQLIAHFLLVSRLMERRGRGFPIMRKEMRAFNGTEPGLVSSQDGRFVRVTLLRRATT
jgi:ATP-dependent DNA helicase RecG